MLSATKSVPARRLNMIINLLGSQDQHGSRVRTYRRDLYQLARYTEIRTRLVQHISLRPGVEGSQYYRFTGQR